MIAKWEKKGEHAYKGFIYFPEDKNKKTRKFKNKGTHRYDEEEEEQQQTTWWNPLSWF